MVRPHKCRHVCGNPQSYYFKPRGIPATQLEEVVLTIDQYEAIRLADIEGLYQEDAARQMNISRQTFGNIIESAHRKVGDAIVNAKALKIEGGVVTMVQRHFICSACHHEWEAAFGIGRPTECPKCQSKSIQRAVEDKGRRRAGRHGKRTGQCRRSNR